MMKPVKVIFLFIGTLCVTKGDNNVAKIPFVGPLIGEVEHVVGGAVHTAADVVVEGEELLLNGIGVRGYIQQALNKFKVLMVDGIQLFGLPRLEPLDVKHIDIDIKHESGIFEGSLDNVQISKLSTFQTRSVNVHGLTVYTVYLNLFFKELVITGDYILNATVGDLFHIHGDGPFEIILHDLDTFITIEKLRINLIQTKVQFEDIKLNITLGSLTSNLTNLMGGGDSGKLFNKIIEDIAPETVQLLWPEIAKIVEPKIKEVVGSTLEEVSLTELMELFEP